MGIMNTFIKDIFEKFAQEASRISRLHWVVAVVLISTMLAMCDGGGGGMMLSVERAFPRSGDGMRLIELSKLDRVRHGPMLQKSFTDSRGVVDFRVWGSIVPFTIGLYYAKVQLGSPPKEFYVVIDTGSDVFWVSCVSCTGCSASTVLQIKPKFFDPSNSSTASAISCKDHRCVMAAKSSKSGCSNSKQCTFNLHYLEGSGTAGGYFSDRMHLQTVHGNTTSSNSSAEVIFGCTTSVTGNLTSSSRALDGILGLGQRGLSVISQLSNQGLASNVFSHCFKGTDNGGGILILGEILEPSIVYTPLVPSESHYRVNLESISINGKPLPIKKSVFSKSKYRGGTVIDSGTTLAYLTEEAYQPLVDKVAQIVSPHARYFALRRNPCYEVFSSLHEAFPTIELNFAGGASMVLQPDDYLLPIFFGVHSNPLWCIGFQKLEGHGMTILGDLVLKDKIVVYDVANQRIGWAAYDCSQHVTVLETNNTHGGSLKRNTAASFHHLFHLIALSIVFLLLQLCL